MTLVRIGSITLPSSMDLRVYLEQMQEVGVKTPKVSREEDGKEDPPVGGPGQKTLEPADWQPPLPAVAAGSGAAVQGVSASNPADAPGVKCCLLDDKQHGYSECLRLHMSLGPHKVLTDAIL